MSLYQSSLVNRYLSLFDWRMARHPFVDNLSRHMAETGMTIDSMLDAARDFDPDGYSREALRSMYNGLRPMRLRMMSAMAVAADYAVDQDPYFQAAVVRYLLDEDVHGANGAVDNLDDLKVSGKLKVGPDEIKRIPVARRKEAVGRASKRATGPSRRGA